MKTGGGVQRSLELVTHVFGRCVPEPEETAGGSCVAAGEAADGTGSGARATSGGGEAWPPQCKSATQAAITGGLVREEGTVGAHGTRSAALLAPPAARGLKRWTMHRTKTEADLAGAEVAHSDDPERAELLRRARMFKASWVELAEGLTQAKRQRRWRDWGYESLEAYARAELRLRPETVEKLTGSYSFLKRRAPSVLGRDAVNEPIPSYEAVDFLRRAEEREDAPRDVVETIRRKVLDDAASAGALSRTYGEAVFPLDKDTRRARDVAGIKNVAKRLAELLSETRVVPEKVASEVARSLSKLLEAIAADAEQAA